MKPPYDINSNILKLITSISEKIGAVNASFLNKPSPKLRKQNKIKTIHSSLKIEGNTLTEEQITAILENKRIIGPQKDIKEVLNAIEIYENLEQFSPYNAQFFYNRYQVNNNFPVSNLTFEELYEEYRNLEGWQHQFMADHYINTIADALKEVHPLLNDQTYIGFINNNYPDWTWSQIYNNIAWSGLTQTPAGIAYLSNTNNANLYSLQNTDVAVNSNKTPNCRQ